MDSGQRKSLRIFTTGQITSEENEDRHPVVFLVFLVNAGSTPSREMKVVFEIKSFILESRLAVGDKMGQKINEDYPKLLFSQFHSRSSMEYD